VARLEADAAHAALLEPRVAAQVARRRMRAVVQLDHRHHLAVRVAHHVVDPLLGDAQAVGVGLAAIAAGRLQQGRHRHLGEHVVAGQGAPQAPEEFAFVLRHELAPAIAAGVAARAQAQGNDGECQENQDQGGQCQG
jgi:hypothetical protein